MCTDTVLGCFLPVHSFPPPPSHLTPHVPFSVLPSSIPATRYLHSVISHSDMTVLLCPMLHDIRKSIALLEGSQASPTCPFDNSNITMSLEQWCNETDRRKPPTEQPYTVKRCPPQSSNGLGRDRIRVCLVALQPINKHALFSEPHRNCSSSRFVELFQTWQCIPPCFI